MHSFDRPERCEHHTLETDVSNKFYCPFKLEGELLFFRDDIITQPCLSNKESKVFKSTIKIFNRHKLKSLFRTS